MTGHVPIRTCIGCGQKRYKHELLRIVRRPDRRVDLDPEARAPGRGAYVCYDESCVKMAVKRRRIQVHLKAAPPPDFEERLLQIVRERHS